MEDIWYRLSGIKKVIIDDEERVLSRIMATSRFEEDFEPKGGRTDYIQAGDFGGWVDLKAELAQDGSWIGKDVTLVGNTTVRNTYIADGRLVVSDSEIDGAYIDSVSRILRSRIINSHITNAPHIMQCDIGDSTIKTDLLNCCIKDSTVDFDGMLENARIVNNNYIKVTYPGIGTLMFYSSRGNMDVLVTHEELIGVSTRYRSIPKFIEMCREQLSPEVAAAMEETCEHIRSMFTKGAFTKSKLDWNR